MFKAPRSLAELKKHISALRHNSNLRFESDVSGYRSWYSAIRRILFIVYIKLVLCFKEYHITRNHYPYTRLLQHLPEVEHKVLWYSGSRPSLKIRNNQLILIKNNKAKVVLKKCRDVCYFENPKGLKSIPSIHHFQVLVVE